jgi:hydrogenase nickel incorporation protein HypB
MNTLNKRTPAVQEGGKRIPVVERILGANDEAAANNRGELKSRKLDMVNIMASPGAGKTTLLIATIQALEGKQRVGIIEGDVASQIDADKIAETDAPVVQINTGGACHLDAPMVNEALKNLPLDELDVIFVENVGNLICPVSFDIGQTHKVALISVPEGHDKPYKYPGIFEAVDLVIITKADLLPYLDFEEDTFRELVHGLNADAQVITLSAKTGEGMDTWLNWLEENA